MKGTEPMAETDKDIRWVQRFENFCRAFGELELAIEIGTPSRVERAGLIQFYEMSFELAWKIMKDYLEEEGYEIQSPRAAIKQAFQSGLIADGESWLKALKDRNLTVHTYDEATAMEVERRIRTTYFPNLTELHTTFQGMIQK